MRQRPRPDAEIAGGEISWCPPGAVVPVQSSIAWRVPKERLRKQDALPPQWSGAHIALSAITLSGIRHQRSARVARIERREVRGLPRHPRRFAANGIWQKKRRKPA